MIKTCFSPLSALRAGSGNHLTSDIPCYALLQSKCNRCDNHSKTKKSGDHTGSNPVNPTHRNLLINVSESPLHQHCDLKDPLKHNQKPAATDSCPKICRRPPLQRLLPRPCQASPDPAPGLIRRRFQLSSNNTTYHFEKQVLVFVL